MPKSLRRIVAAAVTAQVPLSGAWHAAGVTSKVVGLRLPRIVSVPAMAPPELKRASGNG